MWHKGRVVNGRVEVEAELPEGEDVIVLTGADAAVPELTEEEEEEELWQAYQDVKNGNFVTAEELLAELRSMRRSG